VRRFTLVRLLLKTNYLRIVKRITFLKILCCHYYRFPYQSTSLVVVLSTRTSLTPTNKFHGGTVVYHLPYNFVLSFMSISLPERILSGCSCHTNFLNTYQQILWWYFSVSPSLQFCVTITIYFYYQSASLVVVLAHGFPLVLTSEIHGVSTHR
jgi:hypothetical protein